MASKKSTKKIVPRKPQVRITLDDDLNAMLMKRVSGDVTLSTLINDACRRVYLPGGLESALESINRALTTQAGRQRQLELKQQVSFETLIIFIRLWFAVNPELPPAERRAARSTADARITKILDAVADTVGRDTSILGRSVAINELFFGRPPGRSDAPHE